VATKKNLKLDQEKIDFEAMIEKPDFVAQTCNGTAKPMGLGWNKQMYVSAPWGPEPNHNIDPGGPWQAKRSNRTGE